MVQRQNKQSSKGLREFWKGASWMLLTMLADVLVVNYLAKLNVPGRSG
jgi:hypothetical protein